MPKSRYLKGFGIVVCLTIIGCLVFLNNGISSRASGIAADEARVSSNDDSFHDGQNHDAEKRVKRGVNAESKVRSLLQITPGEVANIRIPASGFGGFLPEGWEKKWEQHPLIPITREQAVHGMQEILNKGDTLGSRVDAANGKITWQGDGIVVNGEVIELGDAGRNLRIVVDEKETGGFAESETTIQGHSFFLIRAPGSDAGGVLLVFGEPSGKSKPVE